MTPIHNALFDSQKSHLIQCACFADVLHVYGLKSILIKSQSGRLKGRDHTTIKAPQFTFVLIIICNN